MHIPITKNGATKKAITANGIEICFNTSNRIIVVIGYSCNRYIGKLYGMAILTNFLILYFSINFPDTLKIEAAIRKTEIFQNKDPLKIRVIINPEIKTATI